MFSVYAAGKTGVFKSAAWGVAQAFWGPIFDGVIFLENWGSTANAIEKNTFLVKDALVCIDDFAPNGSRKEVNELHAKAEKIFRSAGNRSGRGRMRADTSLRPAYWPRGLIGSSGEDVPGGHSLRSRMAIQQLVEGSVNQGVLSELQKAARAGVLAEGMAGYVQWIAGWASDIVRRATTGASSGTAG